MKFDTYIDFSYFVTKKSRDILCDLTKSQLQASRYPYVDDNLVFLLDDSVQSYFSEVRSHSSKKPFFKALQEAEVYDASHLPALSSLLTHFAISYSKRKQVRAAVDAVVFSELREKINGVISTILTDGSCKSESIRLLL